MTTGHKSARAHIEKRARVWAGPLVRQAEPVLRQKYDAGNSSPTTEVTVNGDLTKEMFDLAENDEGFAEQIGTMLTELVCNCLKGALRCKSVSMYRAGDGRDTVTPGQSVQFNIAAYYS